MTRSKARAIGLLSGGLDSTLAAKVLQAQDVEVIGVTFATFFFGAAPGIKAGSTAGFPVHVLEIGEKHLEMLKKPVYGYGRQMNPCVDCHALMLKEAGRAEADVPVTLFGVGMDGEALKRARDAGVDRVVFGVPSEGKDKVLPLLDKGAALMRAM